MILQTPPSVKAGAGDTRIRTSCRRAGPVGHPPASVLADAPRGRGRPWPPPTRMRKARFSPATGAGGTCVRRRPIVPTLGRTDTRPARARTLIARRFSTIFPLNGEKDRHFPLRRPRAIAAIEGESVAKALFDDGIRTLSLSVKYRRPRGIFCARGRCVACHMSVDGVPGVPTCITPLRAGMRDRARELPALLRSPSHRVSPGWFPFPRGFTTGCSRGRRSRGSSFSGRSAAWRVSGGSRRTRPGRTRPTLDHTAAQRQALDRLAPARPRSRSRRSIHPTTSSSSDADSPGCPRRSPPLTTGSDVLLVDEYGFPGGHSFGYQADAELASARDPLARQDHEQHVAVTYLPGTTAQGFYPPDTLLLGPGGSAGSESRLEDDACSRPLVSFSPPGANDVVPLFENNDTPGIFGERAMRLLLERDRLRPGSRAVDLRNGSGDARGGRAPSSSRHRNRGARGPHGEARRNPARRRGVRQRIGRSPTRGSRAPRAASWLREVEVAPAGRREGDALACDLLCVALPGQPAYELPYQAGIEYALSDSPIDELRVMLPVDKTAARRKTDPCRSSSPAKRRARPTGGRRSRAANGRRRGRRAVRA